MALVLVQVAFQQADYVAWNLWSAINNKPLLNFRYKDGSLGAAADNQLSRAGTGAIESIRKC